MKTIGDLLPKTYEIEKFSDGTCDVVFTTNVIETEISEENTEEKIKQYVYDLYRLHMPYSETLSDRIGENYSTWLDLAKNTELSTLKNEKTKEMNTQCQNVIYAGIDVETSYGLEHFSLGVHDQQNLSTIKTLLANGLEQYPYHADGKSCVIYPAEDLNKLTELAMKHITYHTTYCNMIRTWIARENDCEIIKNITYGGDLPDDLKDYMDKLLQQ